MGEDRRKRNKKMRMSTKFFISMMVIITFTSAWTCNKLLMSLNQICNHVTSKELLSVMLHSLSVNDCFTVVFTIAVLYYFKKQLDKLVRDPNSRTRSTDVEIDLMDDSDVLITHHAKKNNKGKIGDL